MGKRRTLLAAGLAFGLSMGGIACQETDRYEVLTFFFEGVPPPPGEGQGAGGEGGPEAAGSRVEEAAPGPQIASLKLYFHQPYIKRECASCHNMYEGGTILDPPGGLCMSCHEELLKDRLFIHGPVAVQACLECHHHHQSGFEHVLRIRSEALCLDCHAKAELFDDEYHSSIGTTPEGCVRCHDPHGGDNSLFLKQADVR